MNDTVLDVVGLKTQFASKDGIVRAVDGVDLVVRRGEVVGLVGESGSGKSVTGLSILRLIDPPGRIVAGRVDLRRRRSRDAGRRRDAAPARRPHRDDLPGSDDDAEPGADRGDADDRDPGRPSAHAAVVACGDADARDRCAGTRRHRSTRGTTRGLSAPVVRRHAAARGDRDRAAERTGPDRLRRADDGARRDDPGADPRADAGADRDVAARADLDHARPDRGRRPRRSRRGDVRGSHRRVGHDRPAARVAASPVHARADRLDPGGGRACAVPRIVASRRSPARHRRSRSCPKAARSGRAVRTRRTTAASNRRSRPMRAGRALRCFHPVGSTR